MKRIANICILIVSIGLTACQSKRENIVLYNSSITIAMRLNEIGMTLSNEGMTKLKNYFETKDSLAQIAMIQGESLNNIAKWYYPSVDTLALLLTPLERNDFILATKGKSGIQDYRPYTSELRRYVLYREKLSLSSKQIKDLLIQSDSIEYLVKDKNTKPQELEKKVLTSLLESKQIKEYYVYKNESATTTEVKGLLKQLKDNNLYTSPVDSAKIYEQLYTYKLEQKVNWEYLRYIEATNDHIKRDEARLWAYRPLPIIQLETCQPAYNNRVLDIVCKREKIGLPADIVEALLTSYSQLLQDEYKHKYETPTYDESYNRRNQENKSICQIVPHPLLDKYFGIIILNNAKEQVQKDWEILLDYDLAIPTDSMKVTKELLNYETCLAIANQWIEVDNSREHQFTKSDIVNGKPQLLKQLDSEKRKRRNEKIVKF